MGGLFTRLPQIYSEAELSLPAMLKLKNGNESQVCGLGARRRGMRVPILPQQCLRFVPVARAHTVSQVDFR
jgi:hypothetical protein